MKRWNGWGYDTVTYPLPASAAGYLETLVGPGTPQAEVPLEDLVDSVPPSRLPEHPLVTTDPVERIRHACGQSLPDWVALRSGRIPVYPDGVAYPMTDDDVRALIIYGLQAGVEIIPFGGGTSVVGHINPQASSRPVLTVDMQRINTLRHFDEYSRLATFGAGVAGPDLEAQLRARGCTLGHFPQSFELSTLGGWIATRSSGQQSLRYGRIERLFAGGWIESPAGSLQIPAFPASAAGPDIHEMILGSEGRFGIITEATVRISPVPEQEEFTAYFFPDFERGRTAARAMVQANLPLSMLRLSTPVETATTLALAGHTNLIGLLEGYLSFRGVKNEKCMLMTGVTGSPALVRFARKEAAGMARSAGGVTAGAAFGEQWYKNRFRTPYLRNSLWDLGYAIDTLETAVSWTNLDQMLASIESALKNPLQAEGERVHVFTHLSHLYPTGSSVYTTYLFRLAATPEESLRRWRLLKDSASRAVVACGGTISHQHGVGIDHLPYLPAEKGLLGMAVLADLSHRFDPQGMMNPGKLIP